MENPLITTIDIHMTAQQIVDAITQKNRTEQLGWVRDLGAELTVAARAAYPTGPEGGNINRLVGFNEMQHRIFGYLRHGGSGDDWPVEQLFQSLLDMAAHYRVEGDFGWAVKMSLRVSP